MTLVVCVLRSGGMYSPDHVHRLARGVARHMDEPYEFACLTDLPDLVERDGVSVLPLQHDWRGWWSKLELFRTAYPGPVLYIDLDSIVCGPLEPLFRRGPGFTMLQDFALGFGCHNSSVMSWQGDLTEIYAAMCQDADEIPGRYRRRADRRVGDQAFIEDAMRRQRRPVDVFKAGRVMSWKHDIRNVPPLGVSIVTFHGHPKPWEAPGWGRNNWEALAE